MRFPQSVTDLSCCARFAAALGVPGVLALGGLGAGVPAPVAAQGFGGAVLVVDGQVLVGESAHEREPGTVRGYAYRDGWSEAWSLRAPQPAVRDGFGRSLARSGDFLLVGSGGAVGGYVHVYRLSDLGSEGAAPLETLSDPNLERFGVSLAASNGTIVVEGANAEGGRVLSAFRFDDGGGWSPAGTLDIHESAGVMGPNWLDLSANLLVVADPAAGQVRLFAQEDGGWVPAGEVSAPESEETPEGAPPFGISVALFDEEVLVGGLGGDVVRRYGRVDGEWHPLGTVEPPGPEGDMHIGFGWSLAVHGSTLMVGGARQVYAYERADGEWAPTGASPIFDDGSMETVSTQAILGGGDGIAILGAPMVDFGLGAATVFSAASGEWARSGRLVADHAPLPAINGREVPCDDGDAGGYDCDHVDLLSFIPREELGAGRGARLNDVWGWTDSETGREYALVGRMDGTAFVDVTNASDPRYLGNLAKTEGSRANTWRDVKVFRDHAFVVADGAGQHGMQIFDLTQLRDVTEPREFEATAMYDGIASSHNVAINEETGFAYLVGSSDGGETCGGGSHMVDISDPINPVFAGCFAHPNTGRRNTGNSHDTQCVVYHGPDEDYVGREICVNSNETALSVADVTDKDNPLAVAAADYPNVAYAHQGWLTEDHRYFYSNDELDEVGGLVDATRTLIWDLEDLDDPLLLSEYMNPTNATDHNLYVRGDRLYMSNNRAGLRVLDISDPENPTELGYFDTTPWSNDEAGFDGTWSVYPYFESGTVLLSSRREGLFVVRPRARRLIP